MGRIYKDWFKDLLKRKKYGDFKGLKGRGVRGIFRGRRGWLKGEKVDYRMREVCNHRDLRIRQKV